MKLLIPAVMMLLAPMLSAQIGFGSGEDYDVVETSFKLGDTNKDGKISSTEARELRVKFFKELQEAYAGKDEDAAFEKAYEVEMKYEAAEAVLSPYMFATLDTNRDKKLTKAEVKVMEEGDYAEITSERVMDFVLEEEWQLLSDLFGSGKDKEFDHEVLKKMAADTDYRYTVEMYAFNIYMSLSDTLMDFEFAEMEGEFEDIEGESDEEKKDLTKVKVTRKDALKKGAELWKEMAKADKKAEKEGKASSENAKSDEKKAEEKSAKEKAIKRKREGK